MYDNHACEAAHHTLNYISDRMRDLRIARQSQSEEAQATIEEELLEAPLEVLVRSDWHSPGVEPTFSGEYLILMSTGGPAVRIIGDLCSDGEPQTARIEYQDWVTPWTALDPVSDEEMKDLLEFACMFYYGA
jgi:hypothetical protein